MLLEASREHTATERDFASRAAAPLRWIRRRETWETQGLKAPSAPATAAVQGASGGHQP